METIHLEGRDVAEFMTGFNSVRDGMLSRLVIEDQGGMTIVHMTFRMRPECEFSRVELTLSGIEELIFSQFEAWSPDIDVVKVLWTAEDEFYLSLDPADEWDPEPSEEDGDLFRCKAVTMVATPRNPE